MIPYIQYLGDNRCEFTVWAPFLNDLAIQFIEPDNIIHIGKKSHGIFSKRLEDIPPDTLYYYRLNNQYNRPDPASNYQPHGVHGPSQVIDHTSFVWQDKGWQGIPLEKMIIYELHTGTFTPKGNFDAVIPRLDSLCDLGVNTLNIMPVAQFPGERNWGYDGVYPYAVQNSYGGPDGLKRLVNACHQKKMSVILDVVYNHLGPEGNYLAQFAPYFTNKYKTAWGDAINFDDAHSDLVRNFFIQNALYWFKFYHIDGLRLDAVHAIFDMSAKPFLQELSETVEDYSKKQKRKFYLIAESDLNDVRLIRPKKTGGIGLDAQWCDDFHHSLHALITGEKTGYYQDFGEPEHLKKAFREGFVYSWQYSDFRKKHHGNSSINQPGKRFIVFSQNHDQTGNRMLGERLSTLVSFEALKLIAGAVLFSPYIPLLFMGEEYGEEAPFYYFVHHSDNDLIKAVRDGRMAEYKYFQRQDTQRPPDPQDKDTFIKSKIRWEKREDDHHKILLNLYTRLIQLRKTIPAIANLKKNNLKIHNEKMNLVLKLERWRRDSHIFCVMNFHKNDQSFQMNFSGNPWEKILDSSDIIWGGPGSSLPQKINQTQWLIIRPLSFSLYKKEILS